jgi:N-methylhydantoinase B/oxoprolinase/acetone carboxylase alpha subunit
VQRAHWLLPQRDEARAERLPDKVTIRLRAGDVTRRRRLILGGGGFGTNSNPGTDGALES